MAMDMAAMVTRLMVAMPIGTAIAPGNRIGITGTTIITIPGRCFRIGPFGRNGSPATCALFRLEIRNPQQFRIARNIGADEGLGLLNCFGHGFKA